MAVSLTVLIAMLGVAVDLGRMYIARSELQAFVDAAALAAAYELDGTVAGVARAIDVGQNGPGPNGARNCWNFATENVAVPAGGVTFAKTFKGDYIEKPLAPAGYRFVRIEAAAKVSMFFLPVLPGVGVSQSMAATAVAGQGIETSIGNGVAPFAPAAPKPAEPGFGFKRGQKVPLSPPIDIGQGNGDSGVREAIVNNTFTLGEPFTVGAALSPVTGQMSAAAALRERFDQDTDMLSADYAAYLTAQKGNGRRVIAVPVSDGATPPKIAGFASFLLLPGGSTAEYIRAGIYKVKLFL